VQNLGLEIGRASAVKMCNAAMTKGSAALFVELLMAAESMGVLEELKAQLQGGSRGNNQESVYQWMERWVQRTPPNARRYVSEMQEVKATFEHLGLTPHILAGVVDIYRFIGGTPLGEETPETKDKNRTLQETIQQLVGYLLT
jgi:3-hydroxyisobutyrate dehydrogenase-like beta-hydroxyacid dehydrogenase